jgi:sterol 3beta-glucosyltransferase
MKVVILTIGSRGDVAPFVGLGTRLRSAGHDVAIATEEGFAELVRERGLEFRRLAGNTRALLESEDGRGWQRNGVSLRSLPESIRLGNKMRSDLGDGVIAATADADVLLLQRALGLHGFLMARAMGIPSMMLELFPTVQVSTGDFPPVGLNLPDLGRVGNRALYRLAISSAKAAEPFVLGWLREFERKIGLPPAGPGVLTQVMRAEEWPIHHGFSPSLVPRPAEWRPGVEVDGYWWLDRLTDWQPPGELVDFVAAGPPPVFIGFGSMTPGDSERLSSVVSDAVRRAGVRAVVQAGWSGLTADGNDVLRIGDVPHDWLFPRMGAVVHHGGAGTTGSTVRAGVPGVITPVLADQPFWARQLVRAGVSPDSLALSTITGEGLGELISQAVHRAEYRRNAEELGRRVRAEDGAGRIIETLERLR